MKVELDSANDAIFRNPLQTNFALTGSAVMVLIIQ